MSGWYLYHFLHIPCPTIAHCSPLSTSPTRMVHLLQSMNLHWYNYPRLTVYIGVHSWWCTFSIFGQLYNDINSPLSYHKSEIIEYFYCPPAMTVAHAGSLFLITFPPSAPGSITSFLSIIPSWEPHLLSLFGFSFHTYEMKHLFVCLINTSALVHKFLRTRVMSVFAPAPSTMSCT